MNGRAKGFREEDRLDRANDHLSSIKNLLSVISENEKLHNSTEITGLSPVKSAYPPI